jgi:hypothetical protein
MVFNAIVNNISVISWRTALLVEETEVPRENHWYLFVWRARAASLRVTTENHHNLSITICTVGGMKQYAAGSNSEHYPAHASSVYGIFCHVHELEIDIPYFYFWG